VAEALDGKGEVAVESVDYATYLQLPQLLALQKPRTEPAVHDEMLFVIVHQTHELWFKQMIWELRAAISHIDSNCWPAACETLQRVSSIVALLVQHVVILETMPPAEFQRFRGGLGTASGVQSAQFREIEMLSGYVPISERTRASAAQAPRSTNLRQALLRASSAGAQRPAAEPRLVESPVVGQQGLADPAQLRRWYRDPACEAQRRLADGLLDLDDQLALWRASHVRLVRAMIGEQMGTGGSSGVEYLEETLEQRLLPELRAARQAERDAARRDSGEGLG
jgi:tryptophan 2,3-dioxygenase